MEEHVFGWGESVVKAKHSNLQGMNTLAHLTKADSFYHLIILIGIWQACVANKHIATMHTEA